MAAEIFGRELSDINPFAFGRLVERLLWHLEFSGVSYVDGSGDGGADIVAVQAGQRWVFQVKSKTRGPVGEDAVDELLSGMRKYGAERGAVVTNTSFTRSAKTRTDTIERASGLKVGLWARPELEGLFEDPGMLVRYSSPELRAYQTEAFQAAQHDIERTGKAFVVLATGLGKTVIAGTVIDWYISKYRDARVLVLAHTLDLVDQLERALWRHVPKAVSTQQLNGREKPQNLPGITVATIQTAINYVRRGFRPDFIFVDEAHHTGEASQLAEALQACPSAMRLGATATPWRGDEFDVTHYFGQPSFKLGIEEGMRLGFLADVKYQLFVDNINWEYVHERSKKNLTIKDLNRRLFLPQRDESVRDEMYEVWMNTVAPRGIVFCQTIEHCERLADVLRQIPAWASTATLHNEVPKTEQKARLAKFRLGDVPILVAVDILNEGVDVPDVNIVCFARVTHSRRIFIQQLGRGLRLSPGKTHVSVLDFVSDLKRVAAAMQLRADVVEDPETLYLPSSHSITFNDIDAESLLTEWIYDAADLETTAEETKLNFPPFLGHRK